MGVDLCVLWKRTIKSIIQNSKSADIFYEVFGTTAGTIIQAALSLLVVVLTIRSVVKKRRALLQEFELNDKENE